MGQRALGTLYTSINSVEQSLGVIGAERRKEPKKKPSPRLRRDEVLVSLGKNQAIST